MRIGLLTFHSALNAGAVLQAYALQTCLSQHGHEVEFIDYSPRRRFSWRNYVAKKPKVAFDKWVDCYNGWRYGKRDDWNYCLHKTTAKYGTYDELVGNPPLYDAYVVGSDQVWNFRESLSPVYMLDFVPQGRKKIAYAASMGQCLLDKSLYAEFRSKLLGFDAISLREKNGVDFVKRLLHGAKDVSLALDPTLLLDVRQYEKITGSIGNVPKRFIASYILSNLDDDNANIISYVERQLGAEILNLRNPDSCIRLGCGKNIVVTPYQWLCYIKYSCLVVCSSFHAVAFSILFHKPFVALVPPESKNCGGNMRVNSLLQQVGLTNRIVYDYNRKKLQEVIAKQIDWDCVERRIRSIRDRSISFLVENLK